VARAPWVHGKCAGQGEQLRDSLSKRGDDEVAEMVFGSGVPGWRWHSGDPRRRWRRAAVPW
jgi:hypothetical protein